MDSETRQSILDAEHLRLLAFGYCVSAASTAFVSLFGLLYAAMGLSIGSMTARMPSTPTGPPPEIGWFFAAFGGAIFLVMSSAAALKLYAARCLWRRQSRAICFVIAALSCLGIPYGTVLGICTFVVLTRSSVALLFDSSQARSTDSVA